MGEKKKKYPYLWAVIYGVFLAAYAAYTMLHTFVIPRDVVSPEDMTVYGEKESTENRATAQTEEPAAPEITENSYKSNCLEVTLIKLRRNDTDVYLADVLVKDVSYLRTGLAQGKFGRNLRQTTSGMAKDNGAIIAVNGDYYGFRDSGFVLRNHYLYRENARTGQGNEDLVVWGDGSFEIIVEGETTARELVEAGAVHIFSFGPGLIEGGEIKVTADSEVKQSTYSNPRTAMGMIEPLHYLLAVSDGRTAASEGLSLLQLAQIMKEYGCEVAYNLDGGGSSTMCFMGEVVNKPVNSGSTVGERWVSDIVYIGE